MRFRTSFLLRRLLGLLVAAATLVAIAEAAAAAGDAANGAKLYRACAPCHSLRPDVNMTGPSLAGVSGRKAGGLASFERYSPALRSSTLIWDDKSLDAWLKDPAGFIPHNWMTFPGIKDAPARADLLAFLKASSIGETKPPQSAQQSDTGHPDLKKAGPDQQVKAIRYCRDTYHVTTADGETHDFWEANLRLKTDSTALGPPDGTAAILPAGMMGDRASIFFARPEDISALIKHEC
jgi:cytochrome c